MKNVILKELTLSNWKGQSRKVSFGDNVNLVSGKNASGKTSIIRAWNWLLTGYCDCNSPLNADLFNNKEKITKDTPIASVKAVVSIDNEIYTIERSAEAKFQRKRGTEFWEKASSDSYVYKVDEINMSANDFREWLSEKFTDADLLRFVVDGSYFIASVFEDKKRSRQIIERVVGSVTREEMNGDYSEIEDLLKRYDIDEIDIRASNLSKSIDARLNEIPTVISQKEAEISEIKQTDFTAVQNEVDTLEGEQKSIEEKIFDYSARMKPLLEAKAKAEGDKRMKQEVYDKAKKTYMQGLIDQDNNLCAEISRIETNNAEKKSHIAELQRENDIDKKALDGHKKKLDEIRARIETIKSRKYDGVSVCPVCGRELPQEMQEKSMNDFYEMNKKELKEVVGFGNEFKDYIDRINKEIENRQEEIDHIAFEDPEPLKQKLNELRTNDSIVPFELTEQGKTLQADIDAVVIPEVKMPEDGELKQQAADIKEKLKGLYMKKGLQSRLLSLETDIDALRSEQREKGAELAMYERRRQLVKDFKQEQMEILSHKVNDSLDCSSIDCWSQQKDGTMVSDLVLKNSEGVNFATANQASRILTTCDIQRFFCKKLGVQMPVFIDESSTIQESNLPLYDNTQTFYLFCSDEPLKIETK